MKAEDLTQSEWFILTQHLIGAVVELTGAKIELAVLLFIIQKTVRFKKDEEYFATRDFRRSSNKSQMRGLCYDRSSIYRARCSLRDKGIIFWESPHIAAERVRHKVNVEGILGFLLSYDNDGDHEDQLVSLLDLYDKVESTGVCIERREDGSIMKFLEEEVEKGKEKSWKGRKRQKEKRDARPLSVNAIKPTMQEYCEEYGQKFYDTWVEKDFGCAKNWLKRCEKEGEDPREVLKKVCEKWPFFRFKITRDDGAAVTLPNTVSFSKFYIYRREIGSWLEAYGHITKQSNMKFLDDTLKKGGENEDSDILDISLDFSQLQGE